MDILRFLSHINPSPKLIIYKCYILYITTGRTRCLQLLLLLNCNALQTVGQCTPRVAKKKYFVRDVLDPWWLIIIIITPRAPDVGNASAVLSSRLFNVYIRYIIILLLLCALGLPRAQKVKWKRENATLRIRKCKQFAYNTNAKRYYNFLTSDRYRREKLQSSIYR